MSLRPSERAELRRNTFKPSVDLDAQRRRSAVDIRKSSRDSALQISRRPAGGEAALRALARHPSPPVPETRVSGFPVGGLFP